MQCDKHPSIEVTFSLTLDAKRIVSQHQDPFHHTRHSSHFKNEPGVFYPEGLGCAIHLVLAGRSNKEVEGNE